MPSPRKAAGVRQGHRTVPALTIIPPIDDAAPDIPEAPIGMLKRTADVWDAFWSSWVSNAVDRRSDMHRLIRWIKAVDEYERVLPQLRKYRMVRGSTGQPVINPLAGYIFTLEAQIAKAETEFGMTPMSRLKLGIATGEAAMTAERMNRMLDDGSDPDDIDEEITAGWEAG